MKSSYFCKLLCLLLTVVFLTGCTEKEFDPETDDFAFIFFDLNAVQIINAEGKEIHWTKDDLGCLIPPPSGNMQFSVWEGYFDLGETLTVPYSKSFTVQTKLPLYGHDISCRAYFNKNSTWVSEVYVNSGSEGTVTIHDNNVVEFDGSSSDIRVDFTVHEGKNRGWNDDTDKYLYLIEGHNGSHTKIRLKGDEIVTEGMVGDYTVTKSERIRSESDSLGNWEEVYTKTYSEDGKEK